jgi:hypothetical protein
MFQINDVDRIKNTHFMFCNSLLENRAFYEKMSKNTGPGRPPIAVWRFIALLLSNATHPQAHVRARAPSPPPPTHTHSTCKQYYFSTTTTITRTRIDITITPHTSARISTCYVIILLQLHQLFFPFFRIL